MEKEVTIGDMASAERVETGAPGPPKVDRATALEAIVGARRLYAAAEVVHARRAEGTVDSAVMARTSVARVLEVLVILHGEAIPSGFGKLSERARAIAFAENLTAGDISSELPLLEEMERRFVALADASTVPEEDDRRYDRAFVRSAEWFDAVEAYLERRLPSPRIRFASLVPVLTAVVSFVLGGLLGREFSVAPTRSAAEEPLGGPGFTATYYRDVTLQRPVLTRKDFKISYDWGNDAPTGLAINDGFSVRWEGMLRVDREGMYTFYLASDDGSKLRLRGKTIVDNGGAHAEITKTATISLDPGDYPLQVDYFDLSGKAMVRLEWSSEFFARRVIGGSDLR